MFSGCSCVRAPQMLLTQYLEMVHWTYFHQTFSVDAVVGQRVKGQGQHDKRPAGGVIQKSTLCDVRRVLISSYYSVTFSSRSVGGSNPFATQVTFPLNPLCFVILPLNSGREGSSLDPFWIFSNRALVNCLITYRSEQWVGRPYLCVLMLVLGCVLRPPRAVHLLPSVRLPRRRRVGRAGQHGVEDAVTWRVLRGARSSSVAGSRRRAAADLGDE